ncbi:MAG: conjugal transfer protein [Ruminococcaceae bacterium]|nr:conjugal transfer protein [Oscillospiraceae bacterium]
MVLATTNENCFLLCPICRKKTKTKVLPETELTDFPLYCSRCKTATKVNYFNARA